MYDYEIKLIGTTELEKDEYGNFLSAAQTSTTVLCNLKSVTRTEFYSAAQAGLNPEQVFEINGFEYNGETEVEFLGKRYAVIRTYRTSYETIELTCERKAKNGGF